MNQTLKRWRYWIKGVTSWVTLPIRSGPLKGYRWGVFTGMRFLRGSYDDEAVQRFLALIRPGDVVFDAGAHVGYYTLAAAKQVGHPVRCTPLNRCR